MSRALTLQPLNISHMFFSLLEMRTNIDHDATEIA